MSVRKTLVIICVILFVVCLSSCSEEEVIYDYPYDTFFQQHNVESINFYNGDSLRVIADSGYYGGVWENNAENNFDGEQLFQRLYVFDPVFSSFLVMIANELSSHHEEIVETFDVLSEIEMISVNSSENILYLVASNTTEFSSSNTVIIDLSYLDYSEIDPSFEEAVNNLSGINFAIFFLPLLSRSLTDEETFKSFVSILLVTTMFMDKDDFFYYNIYMDDGLFHCDGVPKVFELETNQIVEQIGSDYILAIDIEIIVFRYQN